MRVTQHHIIRQPKTMQPKSRKLIVGGALLLALVVSGCSAVNMTGFSFPVFGLNKDAGEESDALTTSSMPEDSQLSGTSSGRLTAQ